MHQNIMHDHMRALPVSEQVARAGGQRSEDESKVLNARIEKLTSILEGVNAEHGMLLDQVKASEEGLLKGRKANTSLKADKVSLRG